MSSREDKKRLPSIEALGRIGVVMGGVSSEREISLKSGEAVTHALKEAGCDVLSYDLKTTDEANIINWIKDNKIEVVFIALHGEFGEDGKIQEIFEQNSVCYVGSGSEASQRAMDKILCQQHLLLQKIEVPKFIKVTQENLSSVFENLHQQLNFPVVVKPAQGGSSIGIAIVFDELCLDSALKDALKYGSDILVEEYIPGRELTVGILGRVALPIIEIKPKSSFFDFKAKYEKGATEYVVPALLPKDLERQVWDIALLTFDSLGCRDFARVDLILSENQQVLVLEVNTIPGFTETSLLPKAAGSLGYSFSQLCLELIFMAWKRKNICVTE